MPPSCKACHYYLCCYCRSKAYAKNLRMLPPQVDTTLKALRAALSLVAPGGLVSVLAYVGHPGKRPARASVRGLHACYQMLPRFAEPHVP